MIPQPENNTNEVPSTLSTVNVRTMASDLESIKATGGTHPVPQVVDANPVFLNEPETKEKEPLPPLPADQKATWGWLWIGLAFVVLFLVGYFILPLFL